MVYCSDAWIVTYVLNSLLFKLLLRTMEKVYITPNLWNDIYHPELSKTGQITP
jgi:hypothetical protein